MSLPPADIIIGLFAMIGGCIAMALIVIEEQLRTVRRIGIERRVLRIEDRAGHPTRYLVQERSNG